MSNIPSSRVLTLTPMSPYQKRFVHSPMAEELIAQLSEKIRLSVRAAYLVPNGKECEILHLYADKAASGERWRPYINDDWLSGEEHRQIRDILFDVMKGHGCTLPIEVITDREGSVLYRDCFHIALVDLAGWQAYWRINSR
ncbi:MAG: hypothetical protein E7662_04280 [Ruminococcaceae bacterium]|nr:hypothetical protein [Oscillospiraceae bacterium]